ncbi:MAG: UpxY family transcription antiterminator [Bacteroidaceae bacterium]|nr:UpxY family transcription antiterminator [Bacteroidaceae bacterium]
MKKQDLKHSIPPATVTDDCEACPRAWVAALVHTHCERTVAKQLEDLSFESFVAQQEETHRWSDRMKKVQRVVIPNIVFVKSPIKRIDELKRYSFVRGLMSNPGQRQPAFIPESQISTLRFMLGQTDIPVLMDSAPRFRLGSKVRVLRGSLKGLEGTICHYREGEVHVGVHIPLLGIAHIHIATTELENI